MYKTPSDASALELRVHGYGTHFGKIFPQNVQTSAGKDDFPSVHLGGDDPVILNVLIQIQRPSGQHDACGCKLVDEAGHAVHVLNSGLAADGSLTKGKPADVGQGGVIAGKRRLRSGSERMHENPPL